MLQYNTKFIEYPNGSMQLRFYSSSLYKMSETEKEKRAEERNKPELYYNPFTGEMETLDEIPVEFLTEPETGQNESDLTVDKATNLLSNMRRAKQKLYEYARCVKWEYFVTWTFQKEKVNRYDFDECSKFLRKWLNNQKQLNAPDLLYLVVPEKHKDGAWHFHGLMSNIGSIRLQDLHKKDTQGHKIYRLRGFKYGKKTEISRVEDTHKISNYVTKYITKDMCIELLGRQKYFVSQNLPKPKEEFLLLSYEEQNKYIKENGLQCINMNTLSSEFLTVQYMEMRKAE